MRRTWPHARVLALSEDCVQQAVCAPSTAAAVVYAWHLADDNCERTAVGRVGEAGGGEGAVSVLHLAAPGESDSV